MRVLMATMQLDIGGAETHIVELSKALKKRGVEVFVASNGGAYVPELEQAGIPHFRVGLHSKSPSTLYKAYKSLKKIILENHIDIVHAHARIPGFLCGLLQMKYKFRFVTTAHWVFDTRFPFNLLTDWGDRSLAVSDDIKKYLVDNYKCNPDNIRVTINGVDTEKFSDSLDYSDIISEFRLNPSATRIVYVSRMDIDRSLAAHHLIEAAPELCDKVPGLEIVIVGGGNDFENIRSEAEQANTEIGRRAIVTAGSRTDINKFVAAGDVFVGVSRAALEAMACKKPAIIAGNEGYIGIFDESRLETAIDTNFCCRGCAEITTERLTYDLLRLLAPESAGLRRELGQYSYETVVKHYSVDTMADDALKMYISEIKGSLINETDIAELDGIEKYLVHGNSRRDIDVLISGYYGFHNSGDDSILAAIVGDLKKQCPTLSITVLSKSPAETARLYGVDSANRFDFPKIIRLLRRTKLLISGGGSLIQDVTSSKSLYYYLAIIRLAKLCGARVMLYANGIGPLGSEHNINKVRKALKSADVATLREQSSLDELKQLKIDIPATVTADPVFTMQPEGGSRAADAVRKSGIADDDGYFVIAVREWKNSSDGFERSIAEFAEYVCKTYKITPLILPMQYAYDIGISKRIADRLSVPYGIPDKAYPPELMLGIVGGAQFAVGMRLHTLIYAAKSGIPVIAVSYDPKVDAVMKSIGQSCIIGADSVNAKTLCGFADEIVKNRQSICDRLSQISTEKAQLAEKNTELVIEELRKCQ